jgi:hypothetical protein
MPKGAVVVTITGMLFGSILLASCDAGFINPTESGYPGQVVDLAAVGVAAHSVTLQFTQVDDGEGSAARYLLRHRPTPYGHWGTALPVTEGSCAGVVDADGEPGVPLTCTVEGLEGSTEYGFQVVAFRGTYPDDVVFGAVSSVQTATTNEPDVPGAGNLVVTPSSHTFTALGQNLQLSVTATDAQGQAVSDPAVSWSSTDLEVVTVNSSGFVTARGAGAAFIVATALCCGPDSAMFVSDVGPPVDSDLWRANEPVGFVTFTDWPWDRLTGGVWEYHQRSATHEIVAANDPISSPSALQTNYPEGFPAGTEPAVSGTRSFPPGTRDVYVTYSVRLAPNWTLLNCIDNQGIKATFLWYRGGDGGGYHFFTVKSAFLDGCPNESSVVWPSAGGGSEFFPNQGIDRTDNFLARGEWHLVEWRIKMPDTQHPRGLMQLWVNGQLISHADHTTESVPGGPSDSGMWFRGGPDPQHFLAFSIDGTWGGGVPPKRVNTWVQYGHVYISVAP